MPETIDTHRTPTISVVVVTYNCAGWIDSVIHALLNTVVVSFEVIVLDNGSVDDTLLRLSPYRDRVRIVELGCNVGLAKARNMAAQIALGEYLAFIDHDTVVSPSWLKAGLVELLGHPEAGIVMFKALSLKDPRFIGATGAGYGAHGSDLTGLPAQVFTGVRKILFPLGAGFITSKKSFSQMGGFDEDFFVNNDDIDFGWRAWLLGFEPICISSGIVYHDGGRLREEGSKLSGILRFYGVRNRLCLYLQNLSTRLLLKNLPLIAIGFPFSAIYGGGFDGVRAVYSVMFKELKKVYKKRMRVQKIRVTDDKHLMPYIERYLPANDYSKHWTLLIAGFERRLSHVFQ